MSLVIVLHYRQMYRVSQRTLGRDPVRDIDTVTSGVDQLGSRHLILTRADKTHGSNMLMISDWATRQHCIVRGKDL